MPKDLVPMLYAIFHTVYHCLYITVNNSNIYKDRSPLNLGWLIPLFASLRHSVPEHHTNYKGLLVRVREYASPGEALLILSLVTGRLA